MLHISNSEALKTVYFVYFHSLMENGIILGGNSAHNKTVRIMICVKSHNSCRDLFKRLQILTFPSEYIYSLINFITNNKELSQTNAEVHSVNTGHKHCLHKPIANLSCFQKNVYYAGIKIFNNLPIDLKCPMNEKA
jgi:hypothetical protein